MTTAASSQHGYACVSVGREARRYRATPHHGNSAAGLYCIGRAVGCAAVGVDRNDTYIRQALTYIPAHNCETCQRIGVILKSTLGENGFIHWNRWVTQIDDYNIQDARILWNNIRPSYRADINTLFIEAEKHGYKLEMGASQC